MRATKARGEADQRSSSRFRNF